MKPYKTNQIKVLIALDECFQSPLKFNLPKVIELRVKAKRKNIKELVLEILELSYQYSSYNLLRESETLPKRRRSSLDIWRHCKYFDNSITIFDVMNALFELQDKLGGNYCDQTERRVFYLKKFYETYSDLDHIVSKTETDEYGLEFSEWKNINE